MFDVDGCLIDAISGQSLRPSAADLLERVRQSGRSVVLWSAGGADYAARHVIRHGLDGLVDATYSKAERNPLGHWSTTEIEQHHRPELFIDDCPEELRTDRPTARVRPYLFHDPNDRGLDHLFDQL